MKDKYGLDRSIWKLGSTEAKDTLDRMARDGDNLGYNKIKTVALASILSKNSDTFTGPEVVSAISADLILHNLQNDEAITGALSEVLKIPIITDKDTLNKFMEKAGITEASDLDEIYQLFGQKAIDYYLRSSGGNYHGYPSIDELRSQFNLHRYGLDSVPYDNYLASLHEGEAILTSSTANELRNLLAEYRANNQSSIDLDAIIQNQTFELVNKLNEVISAIRTSGIRGISSTSNLDQANAIQKLQYSMSHLISTKSALN